MMILKRKLMPTPKIDRKCRFFVDNRKNGGIIYNMNIYLTLLAVLESAISLWTRCFPSCSPAEGFFSLMSIPQIDNPIDNHANKHIIKSKMPSAGDNDPEAAIASTPEKPGCYSQPGFFFSKRLFLPYDGRLNKNQWNRYLQYRHIPKAVKDLWGSFVIYIRANCQELRDSKRLDIEIMVHRPDGRTDPQNYLTVLSDIIQEALGVNDRYYRITVDGDIRPDNPEFEIVIKDAT